MSSQHEWSVMSRILKCKTHVVGAEAGTNICGFVREGLEYVAVIAGLKLKQLHKARLISINSSVAHITSSRPAPTDAMQNVTTELEAVSHKVEDKILHALKTIENFGLIFESKVCCKNPAGNGPTRGMFR